MGVGKESGRRTERMKASTSRQGKNKGGNEKWEDMLKKCT